MGISTSPSLWMGDKGGRYYIRQVGSTIWWFGLNKEVIWANVFSGTRFGNTASGYWAELWTSDETKPKGGKLLLTLSANVISVVYQTGGFPEKKLTASSKKPIPFPKFPT